MVDCKLNIELLGKDVYVRALNSGSLLSYTVTRFFIRVGDSFDNKNKNHEKLKPYVMVMNWGSTQSHQDNMFYLSKEDSLTEISANKKLQYDISFIGKGIYGIVKENGERVIKEDIADTVMYDLSFDEYPQIWGKGNHTKFQVPSVDCFLTREEAEKKLIEQDILEYQNKVEMAERQLTKYRKKLEDSYAKR